MTTAATPVPLNADQQEVASKHCNDIAFAASTIHACVKGTMEYDQDLLKSCLSVADHHIRHLGKTLGIETESAAEAEERYGKLRKANQRVHELEKQIGQATNPAQVQLGVASLTEKFRRWWGVAGFGHVSEITFEEYGITVKLSCMLFGPYSLTMSETPDTDRQSKKEWIAQLATRFDLVKQDRESELADSDKNRNLLIELIGATFPSAVVTGFTSRGGRKGLSLHDFTVFIRKYDDVAALPDAEKVAPAA